MSNLIEKLAPLALAVSIATTSPIYASNNNQVGNRYIGIGNGYTGSRTAQTYLREATGLLGGELKATKTDNGYNVSGTLNDSADRWNEVFKKVEAAADKDGNGNIDDIEAVNFLDWAAETTSQ